MLRAARAKRAKRVKKARMVVKVEKAARATRGSWFPFSRLSRRAVGGLERDNRLARRQFLNTVIGVKSAIGVVLETSACDRHVGFAQLQAFGLQITVCSNARANLLQASAARNHQ